MLTLIRLTSLSYAFCVSDRFSNTTSSPASILAIDSFDKLYENLGSSVSAAKTAVPTSRSSTCTLTKYQPGVGTNATTSPCTEVVLQLELDSTVALAITDAALVAAFTSSTRTA